MRGPRLALLASSLVITACGRLGYDPFAPEAGLPDVPILPDVPDAATSCERTCSLCESLPAIEHAPALDGRLEQGLTLARLEPEGWTGSAPIPADTAARIAFAWLPTQLYVYAEIDDPDPFPSVWPMPPFCGDSVEIYVDDDGVFANPPAYDQPGTVQLIAAAPAEGESSTSYGLRYASMVELGAWAPEHFKVFRREGGYTIEALIEAVDFGHERWSLAAGGHVGIGFSVNVSSLEGSSDSCGRIGQYFLRVTSEGCGLPYCDTRALCTPELR